IPDIELAMQLDKSFRLPAVFWAVTAAAEDKNHRMRPLQFREFSTFRGVVGKLVVGENSPRDHVGSHVKSSIISRLTPITDPPMRTRAAQTRLIATSMLPCVAFE